MGGVVKKPRAMDMMGAGRGAAGGPRRRGAAIPPVDFHGTVVPGLVLQDDGRLKDGLVGRSRSARPGGRPRFRGETAQLKLLGGDWIDGQDTLSWCDVETVEGGVSDHGPDERRSKPRTRLPVRAACHLPCDVNRS